MLPDWIAADWGTSNLRAFAMTAQGQVLAEAVSEDGMGRLTPDQFEPALLQLIGGWLGAGVMPVYACGMVGARQGWVEARYRAVPCPPLDAGALTPVPVQDKRLRVVIAPGLSQAKPADVMRGEETQIAGALAQGGGDGVYCLPGTHSKWAHVSAGEVVSFQTFMTGEMFALLAQQSVLRHGLAGAGGEVAEAFDAAVSDILSRPERLAARLFTLRAEGLLEGLDAAAARSRLSGLLIGAELAAAKPYWLGQPVTLIGSPALSAAYARALAAQGVAAKRLDVASCTLAGLSTLIPSRR